MIVPSKDHLCRFVGACTNRVRDFRVRAGTEEVLWMHPELHEVGLAEIWGQAKVLLEAKLERLTNQTAFFAEVLDLWGGGGPNLAAEWDDCADLIAVASPTGPGDQQHRVVFAPLELGVVGDDSDQIVENLIRLNHCCVSKDLWHLTHRRSPARGADNHGEQANQVSHLE